MCLTKENTVTNPPSPNDTQYRDEYTDPITAEQLRSDPDWDERVIEFVPIRPDPEQPDVIGYIDEVPVIHVTDIGQSIYSEVMRNVAFKLPGDDRVHNTAMILPGSIPRHYSGSWRARECSPIFDTGYFLVLTVTAETWAAIEAGFFVSGV